MAASIPQAPGTPSALRTVSLCVLLALLAWSGAVVRGGFAFDDAEAVRGNPVVEGRAPWRAAFARDYWDHVSPAGHYRPLATLSLRIDHALWGPHEAAGWHLTNVALHALVVALAGLVLSRLAGRLPGPPGLPWVGLALFAAHPALADSVAWISGRTSMLSAAPPLAGALVLLHALRSAVHPARSALLTAALAAALGLLGGLLGKEDAIVFAVVLPLLAWRSGPRARWSVLAGCALGVLAYLALRAHALGAALPSAPHAPLAGEPLGVRLAVAGRALLELLRLAVLPLGYPPNYDRDPRLEPEAALAALPVALLGWLPWLAAVALALPALRRRPGSAVPASALLAALSLLPSLQLVPSGALLAPRFLYLPLLLAVPLVHSLWLLLPAPARRPVIALTLAACVGGAWSRAGVYADRASYHMEVLAHRPDDAPAWNELGLAYEEQGQRLEARAAYARATALDPGYSRPFSNLGRMALEDGELGEAERCLRRAAELGPANAVAQVNLGALMLRLDRPEEALAAYRRAVQLAPRQAAAWRGLGRALAAAGEGPAAREALERALQLDPADPLARQALDALGPP